MSIITDAQQTEIEADGKFYAVHTDFKNWLRIDRISRNTQLPEWKRFAEILKLCYRKSLPPSPQSAAAGVIEFYGGGFCSHSGGKSSSEDLNRLYDFEIDAEVIMCDFMRVYGIDLTTASLHWHTFCTLFSGLGEDTLMGKIMYIRSVNLSEIEDKQLRKKYRALKAEYALTRHMSAADRQAGFEKAMSLFF